MSANVARLTSGSITGEGSGAGLATKLASVAGSTTKLGDTTASASALDMLDSTLNAWIAATVESVAVPAAMMSERKVDRSI